MSAGGSRVSIPSDLRKTIRDIKEIAGKHGEDDIYAMLKECNMDPDETAQRLLFLDTFQEVKKKHSRRKLNVNNKVSEESKWTQGRGARGGQGYYSHGPGGGRNTSARQENGVNNRMERGFKPSLSVLEKTDSMNPRVTNYSTISVNGPKSASGSSSNHGRAQSSPDPMVVPCLSSQTPDVGAITCEINSPRIAAESLEISLAGNRSSTHDVVNNTQAALGDVSSTKTMLKESNNVKNNQPLEPSQTPSVITSCGSVDLISIQVDLSLQHLNDSSKALAVEAGSESLPEPNVSFLREATSKFDMKLEKLNISDHQPVIFPDHLQVPEEFKSGLIFGSLCASFGQSVECVDSPDDTKNSTPGNESPKGDEEPAKEISMSYPIVSSIAQEGDYLDNPPCVPDVPDNSKLSNGSISSGAAPKYDQSKQMVMLPHVGPHYPFVHTAPNYGFPIIQPMLGNQLVQSEGPEPQGGNSLVPPTSGSTPTAIQPARVGQSSIAAAPPPFPVFRQPYPPNYFPYGPYFPYYLASNAHHYLGHGGFPQQPSTGNAYPSPAAAAPGVKFATPQSKSGLHAGNPTQFGIPSGYGPYSPSLSVTSQSSAGNEHLTASELKTKVYPTVQGEAPPLWFPASGRETSSFPTSSFYSHLPQGQHVGFSPAQAGQAPFARIYHPAQALAASPLLQQSKVMAGSAEVVEQPSGIYQQPQNVVSWKSDY